MTSQLEPSFGVEIIPVEGELNVGPQHPGSGHMRIYVKLNGDIIEDVDLDVGYVHRSVEKLSEVRNYMHLIPLIERPAILDSIHMNLGYIMAVEKILNVDVPERAQYLRTLVAEVNRIASHLYGMGILAIFLGHSTGFMWGFGDREVWVEILQAITGARVTNSYIIPGGVRRDLTPAIKEMIEKAIVYQRKKIQDWYKILVNNPNIRARLENVGVMSKENAIKWGAVGPNLRASGVYYDVRKIEPYGAYDKVDFEIPMYKEGDAYARTLVRFEEMEQSMRILEQVIKQIPDGNILSDRFFKQIPPVRLKKWWEGQRRVVFPGYYASFRPPKGEAISRVEAGRGELAYYIISDGSPKPYRLRMITPSYRLIYVFKELCKGARYADLVAIYGSLDYFPPEADR
ncbi:NADH-quinone oxidoreductase subunit D [Sulfolobus acidocaldarius]|uniref:NADH-ubiquinone oxidoreductase n=4 Tax=Sulfolobus acidocaldarius TaxID=2285 RepID=Q4J6F5_SULAC|nr:NADH-quinone oxidoreductase subunit D [Sulfolobus acidocaldarius]AAY81626.1 NADH-ubiquinone oxidoreductase [Sulfolobus acidocaldarius DSM 639]AGE72229.1 NADH dehydrogenase subunit D [Sulfolobus acidocaldarius N8]AGE74546.1 NADH dehydrogenase subunit D [Sulfolobus acidocaldarius Ron12/I]ALU29604.1 NADH dehydrogenase [Sulfolobus acidocaldarius]ALU32337.1 NADH dehydrogenase [Sulfolobus acidocaldarius]